eukprot:TRINITY_DN7290_c2_g1_i1.p1 TRINITY_DN7290_c2_g1~~TRINITY_DN7290_c2_g1_i1.p1  ORF type:complete len:699 (-),score=156.37 TRINITY_DN7290_c2_g1_i1:106-2157(-)
MGPSEPLLEGSGPREAVIAAALRKQLPRGVVVCVLGSTKFQNEDSEALVKELAIRVSRVSGITLVTGGLPGVQETFARHCRGRVYNLVVDGGKAAFSYGTDIHGGKDEAERKRVFGQLGDIYITVEGGPGVAQEAGDAFRLGAIVVPLRRSGGASNGSFNFPEGAFTPPRLGDEEHVVEQQDWALLADTSATVRASAEATARIVQACSQKVMQQHPLRWCPAWAVNDRVWNFVARWREAGNNGPVPLGCVCGRGVLWGYAANLLVWPAYVLFALSAYLSLQCGTDGDLPTYDNRLWAVFAVVLVVLLFIEMKATSYAIFCQVQAIGQISFLGFPLTFAAWARLMLILSTLAHMDICSNGFFAATAFGADSLACIGSVKKMDPIWATVIEQSKFLRHLPPDWLTIPRLAATFWALSFAQPIYAIAVAFPLFEPAKWRPLFFWNVTWKPDMKDSNHTPKLNYGTLVDARQNHGNALMAVADVARMGAVTFQDEEFAMAKYFLSLDKLRRTQNGGDLIACLHHAMGLLQRSSFRFILQGFLETSLQLNLQVSLLAVQRASRWGMRQHDEVGIFVTLNHLNLQTLLSVTLGLVISLKRMYEVYTLFSKTRRIVRETQTLKLSDCRLNTILEEYARIRWASYFNYAGAFLYVGSMAYAAVKLWAVFYCPSSLWNLHPYPPNGCVVLAS